MNTGMDRLSSPIEEIVAGFIVWLAYQRPGPDRRLRCPVMVERFLRWQRQQREHQQPSCLDDYIAQLRRHGASGIQVTQVEQAVQLLERYLQPGIDSAGQA
jgi:hypothetical protein